MHSFKDAEENYEKAFGKSASALTTPEAFFNRLLALHHTFQAGQCSFDHVAEQLGITEYALTDILHELGLPATNN